MAPQNILMPSRWMSGGNAVTAREVSEGRDLATVWDMVSPSPLLFPLPILGQAAPPVLLFFSYQVLAKSMAKLFVTSKGEGWMLKLSTVFYYFQASPLPFPCSGGDGKKSLRVDLIPPIPKSARPSDGAPGSAAVPLPSSQHLVFQEGLEMR